MCARAFFTKFSAVFMHILYNDSPRFMGIIPKGIRNRPLFFRSPGKTGIVSTGRQFCGNHRLPILQEPSKAPCRGRPAFWPGSSLQKAILLPTGCVCFEQEKRGPVYPHLVQLSLESFSAPLYNILVIRNKGVPDESSPTHLGRLFFLPALRGTLRNVPPRWTAI